MEDTESQQSTCGRLELVVVVLLSFGLRTLICSLGCDRRWHRTVELDAAKFVDELLGQVVQQKQLLHLFFIGVGLNLVNKLLWQPSLSKLFKLDPFEEISKIDELDVVVLEGLDLVDVTVEVSVTATHKHASV